jgi:hypothetical protein
MNNRNKMIIFITAIISGCTAGCEVNAKTETRLTDKTGLYIAASNSPYLWIDPLTKCEYLLDHGITPRLDRNGKQICRD